jgi:hypothetical protein
MGTIGFYCFFSNIEEYYNAMEFISLKTPFAISYYFILQEPIGCGDTKIEVRKGETFFCFVCYEIYYKDIPERIKRAASEIQALNYFTDASRRNYICRTTALDCEWDEDLKLKKAQYFEDDFELTWYCYTHDLIDMDSLSQETINTIHALKEHWEKIRKRRRLYGSQNL